MSSGYPGQTQKVQPGLQHKMDPQPAVADNYIAAGKLKGKKLYITGGDSGIGRSVVVMMAMEGVDGITIVYKDHEEKDAKDTQKEAEKHGAKVNLQPGDLRDREFVKKSIESHVKEFGTIDILVNNASEQHICEKLQDIDLDTVEKTFHSNIIQMIAVTKFALNHMKSGSTIINTTSVTSYKGSQQLVDYASTKGAITSFTRSLSQQLAQEGIRVNGVAPGPIWTPLIPASFTEEQVESFGKQTPMGRAGQPSECATCYVFLASEDSSYITGSILHPNGGTIVNN